MGAIELDMKMMFGSNLILLLLVNLVFASLSDNVPEEETNRVRRRGPSSGGGALEKRTQFMEECGGDLACVRGKMRERRRLAGGFDEDLPHLARLCRREPSSWRNAVEISLASEARCESGGGRGSPEEKKVSTASSAKVINLVSETTRKANGAMLRARTP